MTQCLWIHAREPTRDWHHLDLRRRWRGGTAVRRHSGRRVRNRDNARSLAGTAGGQLTLVTFLSGDVGNALAVPHIGQQTAQLLRDHGVTLTRAGFQSEAIQH